MSIPAVPRFFRLLSVVLIAAALVSLRAPVATVVHGQAALNAPPLYQQLKAFALTGGSADVTNLVLKRDRVEMTFTGTFYFAPAIEGHVTGAVFLGEGTMRAEVPASPADFEKGSVRRMLGADLVESDFKTAVLRMTDDTVEAIDAARRAPGAGAPVRTLGASVPAAAQRLATEFEPRLTMETGINVSARLALSILNGEKPGVFLAEFDGGKRGRFDFVLDPETRILTSTFGIDAGERGLLFAYQSATEDTDVWMAFYGLEDYARNSATISEANNLVDVTHYDIDVDVRDPSARLGEKARIDMQVLQPDVRAVSFNIGEELGPYQSQRLKNQLRLKAARVGGQPAEAVQEDWEGGFTVFLPKAASKGDVLSMEVELDGKFMLTEIPNQFGVGYLRSNDTWLPRHGVLDRATFDITYHHTKRNIVASGGTRVSEAPDETNKDFMVTKYRMTQPVALIDFAVGPFIRKKQMSTSSLGGQAIPLEFNGVGLETAHVQDDYMLAEMDNAVRYFGAMFGPYPYETLSATLQPYPFGQGFATLLMLAPADVASAENSHFISHETSHQWWGNVVAWRSYKDQWLSEGFAEYSGMLYGGQRTADKPWEFTDMVRNRRASLLALPKTTTGVGKGRLADIGPIILGRRLNTSQSYGAYQALIYNKGALVLRMLHFLLSNPSASPATGVDAPFFAMMKDFVDRHRNGTASTEEFMQVAGEHFARSPIAQKYGMANLNWFFVQWIYQTSLPSYTLDYAVATQADGSVLLTGTVLQENAPANWSMPLPVVFTFAGNQQGRTTIRAVGPSTPFELKLPAKPTKVELDPENWILSEKTTTKGK